MLFAQLFCMYNFNIYFYIENININKYFQFAGTAQLIYL